MCTRPLFTAEQVAIIEECKALSQRFEADPMLYHSLVAIEAAKAIIENAHRAGVQVPFYAPLRRWVSMHDVERRKPEHLRKGKQ